MTATAGRTRELEWNVPCALGTRTLQGDVVVIGGGSAGLTAAQVAAAAGKRVLLIERDRLGGECLFTGCVPSKTLLSLARTVHEARSAEGLGLAVMGEPSWRAVQTRLRRTVNRFHETDSPRAVERRGVRVLAGETRFVAPRTLELRCGDHTHEVRGRNFVLATGSRTVIPPIEGLDEVPFLTHETVFTLPERPAHLLIVGGGPLGCELAQAFARLGSDVTVVERGSA